MTGGDTDAREPVTDGGRDMQNSPTESNEDVWLEVDTEVEDARAGAAAQVLESVAHTLKQAPEGRRYDIDLEVSEA